MAEPTEYERTADERAELLAWWAARRAVAPRAPDPAPVVDRSAGSGARLLAWRLLAVLAILAGLYVAARLVDSFLWVYLRPLFL